MRTEQQVRDRFDRTEAAIEKLTADIDRLTDGKIAHKMVTARYNLRQKAQALRWVLGRTTAGKERRREIIAQLERHQARERAREERIL